MVAEGSEARKFASQPDDDALRAENKLWNQQEFASKRTDAKK
jgi:hypothetical protein